MFLKLLIFTALCDGSHAGTIILASQQYEGGHHILALDAKTGDQKWTYDLGSAADYAALITVSHDGKTAFVYDEYMTILALDVQYGTKFWSYRAPPGRGFYSESLSAPLLSNDGSTIFINQYDEFSCWLGALDSATGQSKWWFNDIYAGQIYPSAAFYPAISPDDATVYWVTQSLRLYAVHASNGTLHWASGQLKDIPTNPSVSPDGSMVFVGGYTNGLTAWWSNGSVAWHSASTRDYILAKPAVTSDSKIVFVGDDAGYITAFDAKTGSKIWEFCVGDQFFIGKLLLLSSDDTTLFVPGDDNLYALAASTGFSLWKFHLKHWEPTGTFCLGDGLLFVPFEKRVGWSDEAHNLYALNAETGKQFWGKTGFQRSGFGPGSSISWSPVNAENLIATKRGTSFAADKLAAVTATWTEMHKEPFAIPFMGLFISTTVASIIFFYMKLGARPSAVITNIPLLGEA